MLKEELAKKRGIPLKNTTQTAAEALITTKNEEPVEVKSEKESVEGTIKTNETSKKERQTLKKEKTANDEKIKDAAQTAVKAPKSNQAEKGERSKSKKLKTQNKASESATEAKAQVKKEKQENTKQEEIKVGRPKGRPSTKISLNVPDEYIEIVNIAAGINHKGNTSSYIVSLIEKDIKANGKVYQQIKALVK